MRPGIKTFACIAFLTAIPFLSHAQDNSAFPVGMGRYSLFLTSGIMDEGSILNFGFAMDYTNDFSGALRIRWTRAAYHDGLEYVIDSLSVVNSNIFEVFFLPLNYNILNLPSLRAWAGIGTYYYDERLRERGLFNIPDLKFLNMEQVNAHRNEFSLRLLGPLLDVGITYRDPQWFTVTLSMGLVPVFVTWANQSVHIVPLMGANRATNFHSRGGSPSVYGDLSGMVSLPQFAALFRNEGASPSAWKLGLSFSLDYSRVRFESFDFSFSGNQFNWHTPETEVQARSIRLEGTLLIPLGGLHFQVGAGWIFNALTVDSGSPTRNNANYAIIAVRYTHFRSN